MRLSHSILASLALFLTVAGSVWAATPREQLQELTVQLQQSPADSELRERLIRLAGELKPPPAVPEEANRAFIKGGVFQTEAKEPSGYELAVAAYREALRIAPWWGDAYFNLGAALTSAGRFEEAIAALSSYKASVPVGSAEWRDAQNRIYALEARLEMASAKPDRSLAGNWKVYVNGSPQQPGGSTDNGGRTTWNASFHYRLEAHDGQIIAYHVLDSDPNVIKDQGWCRRNGGSWACQGDEQVFARFTVDKSTIRGTCVFNDMNTEIRGSVGESGIDWQFVMALDPRFPGQGPLWHETLRKQN